MERGANLLSTHDPGCTVQARLEVVDLLSVVRGRASVLDADLEGVVKLAVEEEPRRVVGRLRYLYAIQPERFSYTRCWVPADFWCVSDPVCIAALASKVADGIREGERWKMVVHRTGGSPNTLARLVKVLSDRIARPWPDLVSPDRVLYIHLIEGEAAVSLLRPDEMLEIPARPFSLSVGSKGGNEVSVG